LRHAVELAIFDLLEYRLEKAPTNNQYRMLSYLYRAPQEPRVISMNYDVIVDAPIMFYGESRRHRAARRRLSACARPQRATDRADSAIDFPSMRALRVSSLR
jgi:hypothetical protein